MTKNNRASVDALMTEAAVWHARMECGTADLHAFEAWRDADPRNAAAFARVLGTVEEVRTLKPGLRHLSDNTRRHYFQYAVAAIGSLTVGTTAWALLSGGRTTAATPIGVSKTFFLSDGTRLSLNTDTSVEWQINQARRRVRLNRGEIALTVPETGHAMELDAAGQTVLAPFGRFNARLRHGALDLLVLEGSVEARPAQTINTVQVAPVTVSKGHALLTADNRFRLRSMTAEDIQFVSAWQNGEVFFNGETLSAAVEEYNRYLSKKIIIGDPSLQGIRLGGRFNNHDPQAFLDGLHDAFSISANRTNDGSIILTK